MAVCDKCNDEVRLAEDVTDLEAVVSGSGFAVFAHRARHIRCSPSRAQYVVHPEFPPVVDDREAFDKRTLPEEVVSKREALYTSAWLRLGFDE